MVMIFMKLLKIVNNKSIKSMKNSLKDLFVNVNASDDVDDLEHQFDDYDFDERIDNSDKPFNVCFFMHNKEFKHENYSNEYDEKHDLFIPSGDVK